MVDSPSLALAFAAGFVSFISPCVLPLVPGYLAVVTGSSPSGGARRLDRRVIGRSLLFIATFSAIFIALGLSATALGSFLFDNRPTLEKVGGIALMAMGALFIGSVFIVRLNRDFRPGALIERAASGGPVVAGAAFAVAWTPCTGPTLGAILTLAGTSSHASRGALLLTFYSAGLALPFLFSALAFNAAQASLAWFKRHYGVIQVTAGVVLIAMGVLMFTGDIFRLNIEVQKALDGINLNPFRSL